MSPEINDALRLGIRWFVLAWGLVCEVVHRWRLRWFSASQDELRSAYGLRLDTPVLGYGPELQASIDAFVEAHPGARFALTSGSTQEPKRIPYTRGRVLMVKLMYSEVFARSVARHRFARSTLYVFSALGDDDSLTGMLLDEPRMVPYLSGLQAPYRVQAHPVVRRLTREYGATAVRLWCLVASNPAVLHATNPSTLSTFFDTLREDWPRSSALIRTFARRPGDLDPLFAKIHARIESKGARERMAMLSVCSECPDPEDMFPGLEAYTCWTGGYVRPFLQRVETYLSPERYVRVPMFSMSTETLETLTDFRGGETSFLPVAPGVVYEFVEEGRPDDPRGLLRPNELQPGTNYAMVVTDGYGLRRYQTDDLFRCERIVGGLPDLRFLRRRSLEYSFTGEKLTALQLAAAYRRLTYAVDDLGPETFFTCVPSRPADAALPRYVLVVVGATAEVPDDLGELFDGLLKDINSEYAGKRDTGRLAPPDVRQLSLTQLVLRIGGERQAGQWESQLKFLPLYRTLWEQPPSGAVKTAAEP